MKKLRYFFLLSLFLLSLPDLLAQRQYDTWYFGANAGMSFAGGTPTPLLDGRVNTIDGSSVISRPATGDLLFYTDGASVWDSMHVVMPNGTGLAGHPSSGQPALIVPDPGDTNLFYIFTTGAANTAASATRYSIIDMRRNGGRGDVIEKNSLLIANGTEKITATRHCNGIDYWVIAHTWGSNDFHAFLITAQGIADTVISSIGETYPDIGDIQGTFQMSPNGLLLAASSPALKAVEIFDFNNSTGEITNQRLLGKGDVDYYGLEFSPNNKRLYVNTLPFGNAAAHLFQFNLEAGDLAAIRSSRHQYVELRERGWQGGQLQLGRDGRIYISWTGRDSLGVIEKPDLVAGAAQYNHSGFWLGGRRTSYGLPNIIDSDLGVGNTTSSTLTSRLTMRPASAKPGETVELVVVICHDGANDLLNVRLDLAVDPALIPVSTGSGPYTLSQVSAGGCDSFSIQVRLPAGATAGTLYRSCVDLLSADPMPCALPATACGEVRVEAAPVDTSTVDYTFHFLPDCPGTTELVQVLFNSRRFTDTINAVSFTGEQADLFTYGGPRPIRYHIRPTSDQHIPVLVRRRGPGPVSAIMVLSTVNGDTFRIRLRSDVKSSTTPFLDITEVRTGGKSAGFDTCLTVTNTTLQTVVIIDTVWLRAGSRARLTSPSIPFAIEPGEARQLCLRIENPGAAQGDTLILGGSENVEACPHCFHHTIVVNGLTPQPSLSVRSQATTHGIDLTTAPNPVGDHLYIHLSLDRPQPLTIELIDMTGNRQLLSTIERAGAGPSTVAIDCASLPSGVYLLRVASDRSERIERIQILR